MNENVLVVDDDAPVRRMLERTLSAEGHAVTTAADGGGALAAVEREVPDLVILDVAMPGIDGLAVTQRLRGKGVTAPILLLTARDAVVTRDMALAQVWEEPVSDNVVDRYIGYLRRKLGEPPLIHTVRGVGFTLRR